MSKLYTELGNEKRKLFKGGNFEGGEEDVTEQL